MYNTDMIDVYVFKNLGPWNLVYFLAWAVSEGTEHPFPICVGQLEHCLCFGAVLKKENSCHFFLTLPNADPRGWPSLQTQALQELSNLWLLWGPALDGGDRHFGRGSFY